MKAHAFVSKPRVYKKFFGGIKRMAKLVRYNGRTDSYYACSEPTELVPGKEYVVLYSNDRGFQTDYKLKGVEGFFNSAWFDEKETVNTFLAIAKEVPKVGQKFVCSKIHYASKQLELIGCTTSTVEEVVIMGNCVYMVTTRNSVYIVQVG